MNKRPEVIQRILLAKRILSPYRFAPWSEPDAYVIAMQLLAAHDAADLVFAAIVDHQGEGTSKSRGLSMMQSLGAIKTDAMFRKPTTYFSQLNDARDSLKHRSNFPNTKQWANAGRTVYEKLSEISEACLGLPLDDIDESELLTNDELRNYFTAAQKAAVTGEHKTSLEYLGKALCVLLDANSSLGDISVGVARAEDAIKLSGFGVHANDFLRLQEFLPLVSRLGEEPFQISWKQSEFGHPGNWREDVTRFCVEAFLNIAPKIQDAKWIPGAIELWHFYDYKVTAKGDNVEIWEEIHSLTGGLNESFRTKRKIGQLQKGESRTFSAIHQPLVSEWFDEVEEESFEIVRLHDDSIYSALFPDPMKFVLFAKVTITCVPKQWRLEQSPDLIEIPWRPDGSAEGKL